MNEPNPSVNRAQLKYSSELTVTPVENISIVDVSHIERNALKEELPDVCERLDDVIEPEVQHLKYELELKLLNNGCSHADVPAQQSKPDLEYDVPLIEIKTEVEEEQEAPRKKRRASDTTRTAVAMTPMLYIRGSKLEDVITENQKKNEESGTKVTQNTSNCTSKLIPEFEELLTNSVIDTNLDTHCRNNIKKRKLTKHSCIRTEKIPFKCDTCQYSCSNKADLIKHIRKHTGEKPFKCDICQGCFNQNSSLTRHIRTHTAEYPYKCGACLRCFSDNSSLIRHLRLHTGNKPYKCQECQICFRQKASLTRHIRTHTGEKPYQCEECHLCFSVKSNLLNHVRTHTGEKPYKCEECQISFNRKSTLTRHIRLVHSSEKARKGDTLLA